MPLPLEHYIRPESYQIVLPNRQTSSIVDKWNLTKTSSIVVKLVDSFTFEDFEFVNLW